MRPTPVCYIAGPMRGIDRFNFPAFFECEDYLAGHLRWEVRNPARHDREAGFDETKNSLEGFDLNAAMLWDLEQIAQVDTIVLLPGWSKSAGVALELHMARFLDKNIVYYDPESERGCRLLDVPLWSDQEYRDELVAVAPLDESPRTGEVRVTNPKTGGQKGTKLARFDLIPQRPLWALAELYGKGAQKYADRNWELGYDWSLSYAALQRHLSRFWQGENCDSETGAPHIINAVFHCFALAEFMQNHPELDDRPGHA